MNVWRRTCCLFLSWVLGAAIAVTGCDEGNPNAPNANDADDQIVGGVPATGSCCTEDECRNATQSSCATVSGTYFDGELCSSPFSGCRGACCRDGACYVTASDAECRETGGEFQGHATDCDDERLCGDGIPDVPADSDQFGICCLGSACVDIPIQDCTGTLRLDADSCDDVDCAVGACCDTLIDDCTEISEDDCAGFASGEFAGHGTTCAEADCNLGACCADDGSNCTDMAEDACAANGGAFKGVGTSCDRNQCLPMPCCTADEACVEVVPEACRSDGGAVLPAFKSCDDAPCSTGLCCTLFPSDEPWGDCRDDFTQNGCEAQGGTFAGFGVTCDDNTFESATAFFISAITSSPETGSFGETSFTLEISWIGEPSFPIRVQGYIDIDQCPANGSCPAVTRNVEFRIEQAESHAVTIADWNECPNLTTVTEYVEPWRFRIVDRHCVGSNEPLLNLRCAE